jgi:hypothetical protein
MQNLRAFFICGALAVKNTERAAELKPKRPALHCESGWVLAREGNYLGALLKIAKFVPVSGGRQLG